MLDVETFPVPLAWGKNRERRAPRQNWIAVRYKEAEAIESKVLKDDVVKVCNLFLVLLLVRLSVSGTAF